MTGLISEEDYRLRGAGDLMGTMQPGYSGNSFYDLFGYERILKLATNDAEEIATASDREDKSTVDISQLKFRSAKAVFQDNSNII